MNRKESLAGILCSACMLLVLTSCRSAQGPADRIGVRYDYPIMVAPQKYWDTESPGNKEAVKTLANDLADAIVRAIREGHIQSLRGRILSGEERFWYELVRKGGGSILTLIHRPGANRWTGKVISEIQTSIELIRQELEAAGVDPTKVRRVSSSAGRWLPAYTSFGMRGDSGEVLRIRFTAIRRKIGNKHFAWILDGGSCFGGIYHTWLTDEEEPIVRKRYSMGRPRWTEQEAKCLLKKQVNYRYVVSQFLPDLFMQKSKSTIQYDDPYVWLTKEDIQGLRQSVTYSEWPDLYNKGKEVMKILFDENGIAKQIFLHGKEVKAED